MHSIKSFEDTQETYIAKANLKEYQFGPTPNIALAQKDGAFTLLGSLHNECEDSGY
jgi:hypothetical protein